MMPAVETHSPLIELLIAEDKMSAQVNLRGVFDGSIDYQSIVRLLDDYKVIFGVDQTSINALVDEFQKNPDQKKELSKIVARGMPPKPGKDGKVEFFVADPPPVAFDESGRADFRNISRYRSVDKGQLLARLTPAESGEPGVDIFGAEALPAEPFSPTLDTGANVSEVPGSHEFMARVHGIFVHKNDTIDVSPVLQVPGNVGLDSGNLTYDGNINIQGNVERGSRVEALGDVTVGGIIESGDINIGGSLTAKKGINTRRQGAIQVGGNLHAVYVDNTNVDVEGSVIASSSIVQSRVVCYSNVTLVGGRSTLTGGEIICFGSLSAAVLGNKNEAPTRIYLGVHYKNMQLYKLHVKKLQDMEKDFQKKADDIEKIKIYIQRRRNVVPLEKKAEFRRKFQEYQEMVDLKKRLQKSLKYYLTHRFNKEEVVLAARDVIHPGVEIHYRGYVEKVKAPLTKVILRFKPGETEPKMEAFKPDRVP